MRWKVLGMLLVIVILTAAISYSMIDNSDEHLSNSTDKNETNNSSINQNNVIPLERPPFLEDEEK